MAKVIADDLVLWPDEVGGDSTRPRFKTVFDPEKPKVKPVSSWIDASSKKASEIAAEEEEYEVEIITSGLNAEGGKVLSRIVGRKAFDYPKPPSLLVSLIRIAAKKGDVVLDSFGGSGTTAQGGVQELALQPARYPAHRRPERQPHLFGGALWRPGSRRAPRGRSTPPAFASVTQPWQGFNSAAYIAILFIL